MSRRSTAGLSIRSDYAQARAEELARRTGLTTTEIVEAALRAYEPGDRDPAPVEQPRVGDGPLVFDDGFEMAAEDFVAFVDLERRHDRIEPASLVGGGE